MGIVYDAIRCLINFLDGMGYLVIYYLFGGYGLAY